MGQDMWNVWSEIKFTPVMRVLLLRRFSLNYMSLANFFLSRTPIPNFMNYYKMSVSDTKPQAGRRKTDEPDKDCAKAFAF